MIAHHICAMFGAFVGTYLGGPIGSISQLTWFTEASTPFVNLRWILSKHDIGGAVYAFNGLMMNLTFFSMRICFYHYMIFTKIAEFILYR